jgi:hypothetical protein
VRLEIAGQRSVEARVEEVGDTYVILGLFRAPDPSLAHTHPIRATIGTVGRRGIVQVAATARQHNDEPDVVRIDFGEAGETIQRRDFFRLDVMTDVVVSRQSGERVRTHTLDLSGSGLMLPRAPDLRMDERVWVAIDVGEDQTVSARGRVVRVTAEGHKGVRFDLIDETARDRLIRYLFARQRRAAIVKRC